jgi:hypothetical protein
MDPISEADIARSRHDPRFKQILLANVLEQLLATLYRMQHDPAQCHTGSLREGAVMAARLADLIRDLDERTQLAESA